MEELELLKEITALLREQNASSILMQVADLTTRSVQAEIKAKEISAENMVLRARIKELEKEVTRAKVGERGATTEKEFVIMPPDAHTYGGNHMKLEDLKKLTREEVEQMSKEETLEALATIAAEGSKEMVAKLGWLVFVAKEHPECMR